MRRLGLFAVFTLVAASGFALSPPPSPRIDSMAPSIVAPSGGQLVTVYGSNFRGNARVFLEIDQKQIEVFVTSVTATQLQIVTPPVDMNGRQIVLTAITVVVDFGTPNELRGTSEIRLQYQQFMLTPAVVAVLPSTGTILGGTRVSILGEGFQAPVRVRFGGQEAQVIQVSFFQIVVIAPAHAIGPVDIEIININSGTSVVAGNAYRYTDLMKITSVTPNSGPTLGGTRVTIKGSGFDAPVLITIAGVPAIPIRVSGTEIVAITMPLLANRCVNTTGPVVVTNLENGDVASGGTFTYVCTNRRRVTR